MLKSFRQHARAILFALIAITLTAGSADAQNILEVEPASTTPGGPATVRLLLTHDTNVQGFQTAMTWDNAVLTLDTIDTTGLDVESILGGPGGIEFYTTTNNPAIAPGLGWGAAAAIFDFSPPFDGQVLPPGNQQSLVSYRFTTANDPGLIGTSTTLNLENGLGSPPIFNVITVAGSSVLPDRIGGELDFVSLPLLKRGDANGTGNVDISDAIFLIQYLFNSSTAPSCLEAADVNDDGFNDVSDAVFLINYQFLDGSAPPSPFPSCGTDPGGASGAQCQVYNGC